MELTDEESHHVAQIAAKYRVNAVDATEVVTTLARRANEASEGLSVIIAYLGSRIESPAGYYGLSKASGLSVSAVKNRLSKRSLQNVNPLIDEILAPQQDSQYVLVDLMELNETTREEITKIYPETASLPTNALHGSIEGEK